MSAAHGEQVRILEEQHGVEGARGLNWWGMVFFIASESLIFANLIAAYLYLEIRNGAVGWRFDNIVLPAIGTVILLSSSLWVHFAGTSIRKGNVKNTIIGLTGTIAFGVAFLVFQGFEYTNLIVNEKFTLSSSIFGSAFYALTGFHGLHVTIGLIFLAICLIRTCLGHFDGKKHFAIEAAEMYWHFVDIVWIFVFSLVYFIPFLR
jgi:cytochrome c oxidase subunit III